VLPSLHQSIVSGELGQLGPLAIVVELTSGTVLWRERVDEAESCVKVLSEKYNSAHRFAMRSRESIVD
jgi:hypothetical protein